jgi:sporulation integral membrane protein YtvI
MTEFWKQVDARLAEILSDTLTRLSSRIPELIASIIRAIPSTAIFLLTFLLAAFYLCADLSGIKNSLLRLFPIRWQERVGQGTHRLRELGGNYLRAYFLLFLMTFVELLLGFTFLRLPYIVLPALLIALVDILPVLGVGTVLVPWGLIELLKGNGGRGGGLLALCAVVLLIRQLLEPRIVGKSIGLHPLATLFSAYAGLQVFGLAGMLLGPAVALLIKGWVVPRREGSI